MPDQFHTLLFGAPLHIESVVPALVERARIESDFLQDFSEWFSASSDMPALLQTVGLALLTILVPFAIAILANFLRQGNKEEADAFLDLDLYVILQNVFVIRHLLLSIFLIFIPPLFWDVFPIARFFILLTWMIGILWLTAMIYGVYQWRTASDSSMRFAYLRKPNPISHLQLAWMSVWVARNMDHRDERIYLTIFIEVITRLLNAERYQDVAVLLDGFAKYMRRRSNLSLLVGDRSFLRAVLEWRLAVHRVAVTYGTSDDMPLERRLGFIQVRNRLRTIMDDLTEDTVRARHAIWYFKTIKQFDEDHTDDDLFLQEIMRDIIPVFLEGMLVASGGYVRSAVDAWEGFPDSWRVTISNVRDKNATMSHLWLEGFLEWLRRRINSHGGRSNENIEMIVRNLFPEVDPTLFLRALIVRYAPFGENKVRALIETEWGFGFGHILHPGTKEEQDAYIDNTFQLLWLLPDFASVMTRAHIRQMRQRLMRAGEHVLSPAQAIRVRKLLEVLRHLERTRPKASRRIGTRHV